MRTVLASGWLAVFAALFAGVWITAGMQTGLSGQALGLVPQTTVTNTHNAWPQISELEKLNEDFIVGGDDVMLAPLILWITHGACLAFAWALWSTGVAIVAARKQRVKATKKS